MNLWRSFSYRIFAQNNRDFLKMIRISRLEGSASGEYKCSAILLPRFILLSQFFRIHRDPRWEWTQDEAAPPSHRAAGAPERSHWYVGLHFHVTARVLAGALVAVS